MASTKEPEVLTDQAGHTVRPGSDKHQDLETNHSYGNLWTKKGAIIAYIILVGTTLVINLDISTTRMYVPFATSDFQAHSLLTTANIIARVADIAAYPVVAKLADAFGRAEGFALSILLQVLGNVLRAASTNISMYVAAAIFYSAGLAGYTTVQQVFIADTTKLINRGLWGSLVEAVTVIPVLYIGTTIGEQMVTHSTWRWGYGMWTIIVPVMSIPLMVMMYMHQRRGKRSATKSVRSNGDLPLAKRLVRSVVIDFDLPGGILLVAGLALLMVPLTLTGVSETQQWGNASTIVMIVIGVLCLVGFVAWNGKFVKHPFMPYATFTERTIVGAFALAMIDWLGLAVLQTFLSSWAMVAGGMSPAQAARLENTTRVTFQVGSVFVGLLMRYFKRSQAFVLAGVPLSVLGQGIFIYLINTSTSGSSPQAALVTSRVLYGVGKGLFSTASQVSCQALVGPKRVAVVTGMFFAMQSLGGIIGIAIAGDVWNRYLPQKLGAYLPESAQPEAQAIFRSFQTAMQYPPGEETREAIDQSYRETQWILAIIGTAVSAVMLLVMFALKDVDLVQADQDRLQELETDLQGGRPAAGDEAGNEGQPGNDKEKSHPTSVVRATY